MTKDYLKIAVRNLAKRKLFSILNIFGLTIGITAFILILNYVSFEKSYDSFHEKANRIYRVRNDHFSEGNLSYSRAITYRDAGLSLKEEIPEIQDFTRLHGPFGRNSVVSYVAPDGREVNFNEEKVYYADSNFLKIFSFNVLKGRRHGALSNPNSVVITKQIATKYFGDSDPLQKRILVNGTDLFTVTAVLDNVPTNSHMDFEFLLPIQFLQEYKNTNSGGWSGLGGDVAYTYLLLNNESDAITVESKLPELLLRHQNENVKKGNISDKFILQPLTEIHLHSNLDFEMKPNGNARMISFLTIVAILIIFIAWMNYINLSTVHAADRAKEVGVRKVAGAARSQLIWQFLLETFLINLLSFCLASIAVVLLLPVFEEMSEVRSGFVLHRQLISFLILIGLFLFGAFLSGLYPAFVLSSFKTMATLKGKFVSGNKGMFLVRSLTIFQYAVTVALISGTITVYRQLRYMLDQDIGVDVEEVVVVKAPNVETSDYHSKLEVLYNQASTNSGLKNMSASSEIPGHPFNATTLAGKVGSEFNDLKRYASAWVDYQFVPFYNIRVVEGRNFSKDFISDNEGVLINQEMASSLGYTSPKEALDSELMTGRGNFKIIGIVENYHQVSLKETHSPLMLFLNSDRSRKYISFKISMTNVSGNIQLLESNFKEVFEGNPFEFFFLNDYYNRQYAAEQKFAKILTVFSLLAIFIACIGLFNLSSITTLNRLKEIAIRKILGATSLEMFFLMSKDYFLLIFLANLLALPCIWFGLNEWLSNYAFRINVAWWLLLIPSLIIVLIGMLTVAYHIINASRINPVNSLKTQ